jgi:quinol monooxygenase YgiN
MVNVLLAILATVAALAGTGLLVSRALNERSPYLVAWSLSLFGLSITLVAMAIGFMTGFGPALLRTMELGGALLAPVCLALGVVELISYHVQVRFAGWLFGVSYSVVVAVIVLLDPLDGKFGTSLPKPGDHYATLPVTLVSMAHVVVVLALVACAVVTALRARGQDREAGGVLIPVALLALAGVLIVGGTRGLLPGPLAVLALGAAAGLIWYGAGRTAAVDEGRADMADVADMAAEAPPVGRGPEPRRRPMPPGRPLASFVSAPPERAPFGAPTGPGYSSTGPGRMPAAQPPAEPYGQITVYTLLDGREEAFDRLAEDAVRAARDAEPDTLVYVCHEVVNAPTQRIFYQLFRDRSALQAHQRLPQVQRFLAESRSHVLVTNVIELKLHDAKVSALPALAAPERRR